MTSINHSESQPRIGGHILVDQLNTHGVKHVFCVPGESYLAVLDGLHDSDIQVTVCRQEGGAAIMAESHGKLTGKPGICMVTRGPGASNAYAGIHIAMQDSTPLIMFVGQIETGMREREAFQEMDYKAVFGSQTKWTTEIDHVDRIPEIISRAFHIATSGRPGPVVIALPEDMLVQTAISISPPKYQVIEQTISAQQLDEITQQLSTAKKPIAILGGSRWDADSVKNFQQFAAQNNLPVAVQFRRQMLFPTSHPCFVGDVGLGCNPALIEYIKQSDLVLMVGGRMSEVPSQSYTLLPIPGPKQGQTLIHVHPDINELNRVYRANISVNASGKAFSNAVKNIQALDSNESKQQLQDLRKKYQQWTDPLAVEIPGDLQMGQVMHYLAQNLPSDSIMCNGAGNYATWLHRYYPFNEYGTQLAPTSGSMGYGLPAAVAAKRVNPDKTVVCFAGDGCFLMHGQEFATAVQYDLPIIVLLIDNSMYGTIRMHQEMHYPARISATNLHNPDFAAYAKAFGGHGETVTSTEEFAAAFERAVDSNLPAIIHCKIDPEAISPATTLEKLRQNALSK